MWRTLAQPRRGAVLSIRRGAASPAALADRLVRLAAQAGGEPSARLQVEILSAPGPRCARGDPACEPIPYEAACVEKTRYDQSCKRTSSMRLDTA